MTKIAVKNSKIAVNSHSKSRKTRKTRKMEREIKELKSKIQNQVSSFEIKSLVKEFKGLKEDNVLRILILVEENY